MKRPPKSDWKRYYRNTGIPDERIKLYMDYVNKMYKKEIPPIFELHHLTKLLGRKDSYLASVINAPESHYREFRIPKRSGKKRTIEAPYPALLECQRWINSFILREAKIHTVSHGFRAKRSILTNARHHLNKQCLLKMDLKDFFHSISERRVIAVFRRLGYPANVSFYLSRLCCSNKRLPQGAATSPTLSNIIAYKMDTRIYSLAKKLGLKYTRYADDMAISGDYLSYKVIDYVTKIIKEEGFVPNEDKTHLLIGSRKKIVAGISVSGETPKLPRSFRRKLKQELHYVNKYGIYSHINEQRIQNPFYASTLYGKLLFWQWIEPSNTFVSSQLKMIKPLLKTSGLS